MRQLHVLFRWRTVTCCLLFGIITYELATCRIITARPESPCIGENCGNMNPAADFVQQVVVMKQQVDETETEKKTEYQAGHNIDPEDLLHQGEENHVHGSKSVPDEVTKHQDTDLVASGDQGPDPDAVLHDGNGHVHSHVSSKDSPGQATENEPGFIGADPEEMLHGESVNHDTLPEDSPDQATDEAPRIIGADPEEMLHGESVNHVHGNGVDESRKNSESLFDADTDIDAILHDGQKHAHSPEGSKDGQENEEERREIPVGATDPEAMLHGGDGHVHEHASDNDRTDPDRRPYGVQDPDEMLHDGQEGMHHQTMRQAMDGSKPLSGLKDPDEAGSGDNPEDLRIGTMMPGDAEDYRQWKSEKEQREPASPSGWLSGFSYITEKLMKEIQAVKKRYLPKFWENSKSENEQSGENPINEMEDEEAEGGSSSQRKTVRTHDEA